MQCPREPMSSVHLSRSKQFTTCKKRSHCVTLQLLVFKACLPLSWDVYFLPLSLLALSVKRTRQVKQVTSDWISIFGNRCLSWGRSRFKSSWALSRGAMATEQAQKWLNQVKFAGRFNSLSLQINKQNQDQCQGRTVTQALGSQGRGRNFIAQFGFYSQVAAYYSLPRLKFTYISFHFFTHEYIFILIWWVPTKCHVLFLTVEIKDDEQDKVTAQWNTPPNRRDRG